MAEDDSRFEQVENMREQERLNLEARNQTISFIEEIKGRVSVMGANDSEITVLNDLLKRFEDGQVNFAKAKEIAQNVLDGKQEIR